MKDGEVRSELRFGRGNRNLLDIHEEFCDTLIWAVSRAPSGGSSGLAWGLAVWGGGGRDSGTIGRFLAHP
jgi:hypothetical protein